MKDILALANDLPDEAQSPVWQDDSYFWEFFVPELIRRNWEQLDEITKAAVYATVPNACEHLRGSGCFDY